MNATERKVWAAWNALPENCPNPVRTIAADLDMAPADVAFIVYPAEVFGPWDDTQETGAERRIPAPNIDYEPLHGCLKIVRRVKPHIGIDLSDQHEAGFVLQELEAVLDLDQLRARPVIPHTRSDT